jgi:radical SAM protein with 4Fe4S-binding SPASM domain
MFKSEKCVGRPIVRNIEITNACMMSCIMCPRNKLKRKIEYMDYKFFKQIIDQCGYNDCITLHGYGDPLLHPEVVKMINYCGEKGIKVWISTNPKKLTEKKAREILNSKLHMITISLDSVDDKTYKYFRGKNADYKEAVKNINNLLRIKKELKSKVLVSLSMIRMAKNKDQVEKFKQIWGKEGVDDINITQFRTFSGNDGLILEQGDNETYSDRFKKQNIRVCSEPWSEVTILVDGSVVPCCYDAHADYPLGNLKKDSLKTIWNSQKAKNLRVQLEKNKPPKLCKNCREKYKINFGSYLKWGKRPDKKNGD